MANHSNSVLPLHQASGYGYIDVARLLIDRGADVNAQEENRLTPLHVTSHFGHLDIAKLLIDRGANVDNWNDHGEGNTPFHMTAYQGHLHVTKFLLECGIDVDIRNGNEQTSLYLASCNECQRKAKAAPTLIVAIIAKGGNDIYTAIKKVMAHHPLVLTDFDALLCVFFSASVMSRQLTFNDGIFGKRIFRVGRHRHPMHESEQSASTQGRNITQTSRSSRPP
jgi:hypothetical protein